MKFWEICKSDATFTVKTFWAGGQKVLSDWQIWRSFMPIRAVEISKKFLIFLFSPPYLDFPPPKPLPSTPQSFFPPFKTFFGTWKKIFFGKFSHLALFGTFWPNLPKHGLLGLKPEQLTRAFISRDKISRFLAGTPFPYFFFLALFVNFWLFLPKTAFFLPFFKRTINLVIF